MTAVSVTAQIVLLITEKNHAVRLFGNFSGKNDKDKGVDEYSPENAMELITGLIKNQSDLSTTQVWTAITVTLIFTLLTIQIVQKTRRDAKVAYEIFHVDMSRYKDQEALKTRTLHVKGVLSQDTTGLGIENHLNEILKKRAENMGQPNPGRVVQVQLVPDFTAQLKIEFE